MKICYNCFHEIDDDSTICRYCYHSIDILNETQYPNAIPCGTVLIEKYLIGRVLGQGGFGITYAAKDTQTGDRVAIKEYFPDTMATRNSSLYVRPYNKQRLENYEYGKERFLEEAKTLAEFMSSPNIVKVISFFESNGTAYFVMEYLVGTSLKDYIKENGGKLTWQETAKILSKVMDALSEVHEKGIIHRDVTPDNMVLLENGTVKLLDFGAARYSIGEKSQSLDIILKHGFAPYEQYMRHSRQGPFTDVYALAATFYYAITGIVPPESIERFDEDNLKAPSALGIQLPTKAEEALMKALSVRPENRYQTMSEFKSGLGLGQKKRNGMGLVLIWTVSAAVFILGIFLFLRKNAQQDVIAEDTGIPEEAITEETNTFVEIDPHIDTRTDFEKLLDNAEQGNAESQYVLGLMYEDGSEIEKDYTAALGWYEKAAEQGNDAAQVRVGRIYKYGLAGQQDDDIALEWFQKAAEQDNAEAQNYIGMYYYEGTAVDQSYEKALEWYLKAAEQGYATAQNNAGWIYAQGLAGDADSERALEWFTKAAEQDYAAAQNNLGYMYMEGIGVVRDYAKAREWFEKASSLGYGAASFSLGEMYYRGIGVDANREEAIKWYEKSSEQGYEEADKVLESI